MTAEPSIDERPVRFNGAWTPPPQSCAGSAEAATGGAVDLSSRRSACPDQPAAPASCTADALAAVQQQPVTPDVPSQGWRRLLFRLIRLNLGPSAAEREERRLDASIATSFSGPRHVLFANPKGGAGKTTTCLGVAATFGQRRGRGVVAFDNNPTRGTLGLRAQPDVHRRTVTDLLDSLDQVQRVGDLAEFLRAQRTGHFDVLASDEDPGLATARTDADFQAVLRVLDAYYSLVCIDTSNDVTAPVFTAALRSTDQLVVTTAPSWDSAYSASWMLDHLEQHGAQELVRQAVTVITLPPSRARDLAAIGGHFRERTRAVLHVPYDPSLDAGNEIVLDTLRPATRRAWLDIAATVAESFPSPPAIAAQRTPEDS